MNGDDNPRSPKRRRLSTDKTEQTIAGDVNASESKSLSEDVKQNAVHETEPENAGNKPPAQKSPARSSPLDHLPALDLHASHILSFLSRLTPADAMGLSNRPNAASSREYASLRASFDRTRRLISPGWPFLSQYDLGLRNSSQVEIIRKANQAIFMSSIFTGEIGLRDMDRSFLAVFVPDNGGLLKAQGSMYLELKTQGFITAWRTGAAPPSLVMSDLFGPDLDKALLARRPGTTALTSVEEEFLIMLNSRRSILENAVKTKTLDQLPLKYRWEDFSREVSSYLITHIEKSPNNSAGFPGEGRNDLASNVDRGEPEAHLSLHATSLPSSLGRRVTGSPSEPPEKEDFVTLAARAAEVALRSTLGLAYSDKIPDVSSPRTSASTPAVQPEFSTTQTTAADSKGIQPNVEKSPSSVQDAKQKIGDTVEGESGEKAEESRGAKVVDAVSKSEPSVAHDAGLATTADDSTKPL